MGDFFEDKTLAIIGLIAVAIIAILYGANGEGYELAEKIVIAIGSFVTGIKMDRQGLKTPPGTVPPKKFEEEKGIPPADHIPPMPSVKPEPSLTPKK